MDNGYGRGFLAEMQCVVISYSYARQNGMDFFLDDSLAPLYFSRGFGHYFDTSWQASAPWNEYDRVQVSCGRNVELKPDMREVGIWDMFAFLEKQCTAAERRHDLLRIFTLTPRIHRLVTKNRHRAEIHGPYACLHVRRGDKIHPDTQTGKRHEIDEYVDTIQSARPDLRLLFICSDDYRSVEELREYQQRHGPGFQIRTLIDPEKRGFDYQGLASAGARMSEGDVVDLLTDLWIASDSQLFVGTHSSSFFKVMKDLHRDPASCLTVGW
jgi:hypothetical protein